MHRDTDETRHLPPEWSTPSLGPSENWPQSLRTASSLCLSLPYAACLAWGAARAQLFNERYSELFAPAHKPRAGEDFADTWRTDWPKLAAAYEQARCGRRAVLDTSDGLLQSARLRRRPNTLSFLPVLAEGGSIGGVLVLMTEARELKLERAARDSELLDYVISHDLLAPARTMQAMAAILSEEKSHELPPDLSVFLKNFSTATASLNARLEGLVRFRHVSSQPLRRETVDVNSLVSELVEGLRNSSPHATRASVIIGQLPKAQADRGLLRQVFAALLSNAFKFTRDTPAPRIELGARTEAGRLLYTVSDNGVGFDMKYASRLFSLFQRLHGEFEGTGVDLAVAKRIVERHGGTLRAEGARGLGATFEIGLPQAPGGAAT
jgi:signal transduction histidine kinase